MSTNRQTNGRSMYVCMYVFTKGWRMSAAAFTLCMLCVHAAFTQSKVATRRAFFCVHWAFTLRLRCVCFISLNVEFTQSADWMDSTKDIHKFALCCLTQSDRKKSIVFLLFVLQSINTTVCVQILPEQNAQQLKFTTMTHGNSFYNCLDTCQNFGSSPGLSESTEITDHRKLSLDASVHPHVSNSP